MLREIVDRIRRYYRTVVLPNSLFEDEGGLTLDEKKYFISNIIAKAESRRVIEKYIKWKIGIKTRAAMRSLDDRETLKMKEQAYALGEQTIDFQNFWNEVNAANLADEEEIEVVKPPKKFRVFGSPSEDDQE